MHRTLFIDIDGTLINEVPLSAGGHHIRDYALLAVMRDMAVISKTCSAHQATLRIERILDTCTWWDWHDFLKVLGLEPATFWPYADARFANELRPIEANLDLKLERLSTTGCRLCITSNNPASGIRHKLRLAGLHRNWQRHHIERIFGTDIVRSMKWDREFWKQAIALADTPVAGITVIGNDWHDDVMMPYAEGIRHFVFLDFQCNGTQRDPAGATVHRVASWSKAVEAILQPTAAHPNTRQNTAPLRETQS